jgi:uncharacterized membrane protein
MSKKNLMLLLLTAPALGHALSYLPAVMEHILDTGWIDHARFHALQSLIMAEGWNLFILYVIWFPLRRGENWTKWALLGYLIAIQLGYFITMALLPEGTPPELVFNLLFAVSLGLFAVGYYLAWNELRTGSLRA